jgi:hypothetical protein
MIDFLITIIRLPVAGIATPIVVVVCLVVLPFETVALLVSFPFAAVMMTRDEIRSSWLGSYPNSLMELGKALKIIWNWAISDLPY